MARRLGPPIRRTKNRSLGAGGGGNRKAKPKRWATGKQPGWKNKARQRGVPIRKIRRVQRRVTQQAGRKYRPYRPGRR